jgi:outer membrane receptor for ferrienterochelin and colicins
VTRSQLQRPTLLAWTITVFLAGPPALADDAAQARFHDQRARSLYQEARFEAALREFFIVRRLAPQAQTLFNIALCFDQLGQADQAFYYFGQFLENANEDEERRNFANAALDRLRPGIAQILVESDPPGAEVFLDRIEHGSWGQTPVTVPTTEGTHEVWVSKPGFRRTTKEVVTQLGKEAKVEFELTPVLGTLKVNSVPDANILLSTPEGDMVARGQTPFEKRLTPGVYVAELSAPANRPERVVMTVVENQTVTRRVLLERLPSPKGELTITSNELGALIELDGEPTGFAPVLLTDVDIGLRTVRISHEGSVPWEGQVDIQPEGRGFLASTLRPPAQVQRSPWTWVTGGIGLTAITAGIITGAVALQTKDEFDRLAANPDGTNLAQLKSQGETFAAVADSLYITGGIALATSIVLFFATAKKTKSSAATFSWDTQ